MKIKKGEVQALGTGTQKGCPDVEHLTPCGHTKRKRGE
jgi:hypothetical protein